MKRILINAIMAAAFICVPVIVIVPFMAEIRFNAAKKCVAGYLWIDAEKRMEEVLKIDPYDSRYFSSLGEFLFIQAGYKDNQASLLKKAEVYYERASLLNPRCAEYFVKQGQIYVSLFLEGQRKEYIEKAFNNFRKALANDPNGFNTAYAVGYSGLAVWKYINENERALVIDRLRFSLKQKPWYSDYIYPRVIEETGSAKILESVE